MDQPSNITRVLVTGGAGFIGSKLVSMLAERTQWEVLIVDSLHPQVHGINAPPPRLPSPVRFVQGDVGDAVVMDRLLADFAPDLLFHFAAETGTGESWSEPRRYSEVNITGTASLVESIRRSGARIQRIVPVILTSLSNTARQAQAA